KRARPRSCASQWRRCEFQPLLCSTVLEGFGLLRRVGMIRTTVHLELREELAAEDVLRQHALHGLGDRHLGAALEDVARGLRPETTRLTAVADVLLLEELAPREQHLLCVDDDDEVTGVDVRGEGRLVLSTQDRGDEGGEAAEGLAFGVDYPPFAGRQRLGGLC